MGLLRRVIRITAKDSPNVRLAYAQHKAGIKVTGEQIVPGVLSWQEYLDRRATWDEIRQAIGLDASFYEGGEHLMFPPEWLDDSELYAEENRDRKPLPIICMGVDPGEGGANSSWVIGDRMGILEKVSLKTPDTTVIPQQTLVLMNKWKISAENILFDRGGGGKQHVDLLRNKGHRQIRAIAFGESMIQDVKVYPGNVPIRIQREHREERYEYKNRRAQMYWELRELLNPNREDRQKFGIPAWYPQFRQQLAPIPLVSETWNSFDGEGRVQLPPKTRSRPGSNEITMMELIGHSPDEADALVLMVHGLLHKPKTLEAGAVFRR